MNKFLALSALGPDGPGTVQDFTSAILDCGCNIVESRMTRLGSTLGIHMLVAGNWRTISRLEQSLPGLAENLGVEIAYHEAEDAPPGEEMLPYAIDLVTRDQPGILHRLVRFLTQRRVHITDLSTSSYTAKLTSTPMVSLNVAVSIPAEIHIATLREDFMILCDELNIDAVLEPIKG